MSARLLNQQTARIRQVGNYIKGLIIRGKLPPGTRLPSYSELANSLDAAYVTVKFAYDALVAEGIVDRMHGRGCFVKKQLAGGPGQLDNIGILFSGSRALLFQSDYLVDIVRGVMIESHFSRADVVFLTLNKDGLVTAAQLEDRHINGVVLLGMESDDYLHAFSQWGTPGVVVDYHSPEIPLDFIACDNASAAMNIVQHLAAQGHRRVGYCSGRTDDQVHHLYNDGPLLLVKHSSDVRERNEGVLAALKTCGLESEPLLIPREPDAMKSVINRWMANPSRPTAVIADDNTAASILIREFQAAGVRVPDDVSICAVASPGESIVGGRRLTACRFDFVAMGKLATRLLVERCADPESRKYGVHRMPPQLIAGDSTKAVGGAPNADGRASKPAPTANPVAAGVSPADFHGQDEHGGAITGGT